MANIFEVLKADHTKVEQTLQTLDAMIVTTQGPTERVPPEARAVTDRLIMDESRHEAAEEQYFWPAVREKLPNGEALAATAIEQETAAKQILDALDGMSVDNVEFASLIARFIPAARAHVAYEESEVWPALRAALSSAEQAELGTKVERAKAIGPTRPHPKTPPQPGVLKTAGVAAAVTDKLRDVITRRGRD